MDRIPALHRRIQALAKSRPQNGIIMSVTTVRQPPHGFGSEPYSVALIALEDGSKVMAQLTKDGAEPVIGADVTPVLRRIRTMENGLHVNDFKYRVMAPKTVPILTIRAYVLALTGPAGVGKSTVTRSLLSLFSSLTEQVPVYTTRRLKSDDIEPHVHVDEKTFDAMVRRGEIIAHTTLNDRNEYRAGYRRKDIEAIWKRSKLPIVTTDVHLLAGLAKAIGRESILSCGLLPPGASKHRMLSSLLRRLRLRGGATDIQLESAKADLNATLDHAHLFDHVVVNDQLETAVATIKNLVESEQM